MEDAPRLTPRPLRRGSLTRTRAVLRERATLAVALALMTLGGGIWGRLIAAEDPAAEVTEAVRRLGPPAVLWGRFAVEEESPDGPWTPLSGIEVEVYPAVPSLLADLERIRRSARESGAEYESAVTRLQAALAAYRTRVATVIEGAPATPGRGPVVASRDADGYRNAPESRPWGAGGNAPSAPSAPSAKVDGEPAGVDSRPGRARRRTTDTAGLFLFDDLPSGDWLLVAIRITPLGQSRGRQAPRALSPSRARNFLPSAPSPTKEGEVWLVTVRLTARGRTSLVLTDRARWMAGPVP